MAPKAYATRDRPRVYAAQPHPRLCERHRAGGKSCREQDPPIHLILEGEGVVGRTLSETSQPAYPPKSCELSVGHEPASVTRQERA